MNTETHCPACGRQYRSETNRCDALAYAERLREAVQIAQAADECLQTLSDLTGYGLPPEQQATTLPAVQAYRARLAALNRPA